MKKKTSRLIALDRKYVWHPFTQMKEWTATDPLIIERAQGNYLIDTEGRRYLDGVSSLWVNVHGHRKKEIDRAIKEQLGRISHSTLLGLGNTPSIELAERLVNIAPRGLTKVFFSDNGSTAVEIALKMAFQYWEQSGKADKKKFIAFTGAYHGDTFGSMSVGEIDIFVKKYRPLLFSAFRAPYPYCYRCPLKKNYPDCKTGCLDVFEETLKRHHEEIAACVIEPLLQGAAGMVTSPPGFLKEVRRLTRKYGVLLIADEVATGFGRTGAMFACDIEMVSPDFLCLAKGITGGYMPLAATLTTEKVYKAFLGRYEDYRSFFHGHTYTGNPLGCAAALANLDIFEKEKVLYALLPKIDLFKKMLQGFNGLKHAGDIRQTGLVAGVELVKDRLTKEPYPAKKRVGYRACLNMRKYGVILRPLGDVIVIMPPLSIKTSELKKIMAAAYRGIKETTEGL
ncbi:MAG TPA: adenosylmethionine--8-amino-7-oxononanoate transaminase [Deltaproteobacteria bacterium]|nr:MAG: adenosylmethionine--8-amino-7-oxononanoate transaminase [Deltaproteobacteria bacterium GWA2_55_82]OGQ63987.1 MAG: adenosylmethionine--8-amino-7-oxononanoate transaminase [Deltaproteobacteria bacterium RIFCSPLOWO2_02_FULL_55_12]OIJ73420.1 MAG: adenosylmethionine--8-amino-7-oxononanoate transaminase [Deltaproteobacteria bacterium GWC2_55_46]HBG47283.1 adenosylmethionine--8-amino-7-oxononanoate transaminase [Deltaproteobacteria bacterium]HCY10049.1 adenosylmethionine--8-amino-7-oxononanoat